VPITITPLQPFDKIGPGLGIVFQSSFIGPLAVGSHWNITLGTVAEPTVFQTITAIQRDANQVNFVTWIPWADVPWRTTLEQAWVADGTTVFLNAELRSPTNVVIDSGSISKQFDSKSGLAEILFQMQEAAPTSTFTATDRNNMNNGFTNVLNGITATLHTAAGPVTAKLGALFSRHTLDALTLAEITSGPTGAPVRATVETFWYGVIVRITTIPDALQPQTPDGDWFLPDLAVLRVRRGVDLEYRHGIHTSSWMALSPWKYGLDVLNLLELGAVPPETEILVDFKPGVEGRVYLMAWP
jgi:hypothetical protein